MEWASQRPRAPRGTAVASVTDRDGNVTTFERGVAGGDLVITGPSATTTSSGADRGALYTTSLETLLNLHAGPAGKRCSATRSHSSP